MIIRSSAVGEDSQQASFAGQLDSTLNVTTGEELGAALQACWASYWSDRSLFYQRDRGISLDGMGVLMKPQLTWQNATWVISTEVLDYSVVPSFKALSAELEVRPGQLVDASVRETGGAGSGVYTLTIGARAAAPARGGARVPAAAASATSAAAAVSSQVYTAGVAETRAYAVMEHQVSGLLLIDCFAAVMRGAAARACLAYR